MAEVKKTRKKPVAKETAQNTVDTAAEELEQTAQPETAVTAEHPAEQPVAEKPVKKKSSKQPAKTTKAKEQDVIAAPNVDEQNTENQVPVEEAKADEPAVADEQKTDEQNAADEQKADEQTTADEQKADEQPVAADEQKADEQPVVADEKAKSQQPTEQSKKPAKASGKKLALSKNMIIIISCVFALVIIGVILAVCLTSCNGGNKPKQYTVTFDTKGGTPISSYKLTEGEKIRRPQSNPTKEMFTFDDWYWENPNKPGETQKFEFDTVISQNITLIAGWRGENSVKVVFDANGGAFENNKEVSLYGLVGSLMTEPDDVPTRFGYEFGGWYEDKECYNPYAFYTYPTENATLYAGWDKSSDYAYISYYGNGELLRVDPVLKGEDIVIPNLFDRSDWVTNGKWYTDSKHSSQYTARKAFEDLDLYASYYTVGLTFSRGTVTGYNGTATEVVVPTYNNTYKVEEIGSDAFYRTGELPAITSVKLPDTIKTIGNGAFYNCQYLAEINLTEKVTSIGVDAFYRNIRLRYVGDTSGVTTLSAGAFNGCKDLREFTFNPDMLEIGDYAFNGCERLAEVELPVSLMTIGEYAFSGCTSLKSVALDSMVLQTVGDNAFADCSALTEVTIGKISGAVTLDGNPFANCRSVTVYVPSSLLDTYKNNTDYNQFKDKFAAIR